MRRSNEGRPNLLKFHGLTLVEYKFFSGHGAWGMLAVGLFLCVAWSRTYGDKCGTAAHSVVVKLESQTSPYWKNYFAEATEDDDSDSDSDYDVRDARGRKIKNQASRSALRGLFAATVIRLLVEEDLPIVSSARKVLEQILTPLSERIARAVKCFAERFALPLFFNFKRFLDLLIKNLLPLSIIHFSLFFSPTLAENFLFSIDLPIRLPLRC